MNAYKFLASGAIAPFTGFRWPAAGRWVEAAGSGEGRGVYACRPADLPYWVGDELWRIELKGPIREHETQIEAARGRLLEPVAEWDLRRFGEVCALRTRDLAVESLGASGGSKIAERLLAAGDLTALLAVAHASTGLSGVPAEMVAYVADATVRALEGNAGSSSHTAAVAAVALRGHRAAFVQERRWQARWLSDQLALEA